MFDPPRNKGFVMEMILIVRAILIAIILIILVREIYMYFKEVEIRRIKVYKYIFIIFMAIVVNIILGRFFPNINLIHSKNSQSTVIGIVTALVINYFWPSKQKEKK